MNSADAKKVLMLYRPDSRDDHDPEIAAALGVVRQDPELEIWFRKHCEFQKAMRGGLRKVQPPAGMRDRILASRKVVPLPLWQRPAPRWMAAAAAVAMIAVATSVALRSPPIDRFENYQSRMVASTVREYHLDLRTPDMEKLREHLAAGGAPADYQLTPGLKSRQLTGGAVLKWQGHKVSMVCFDRGDNQMLFLFVTDRASFKNPPPMEHSVSRFDELVSISWTSGDKIYTLAGPNEPGFTEKYL